MRTLTNRKEMAQAMNFGKYPVLIFDIDKNEGSKARVMKKTINHGNLPYNCQLRRGYNTKDDGIFYLSTNAAMLRGNMDISDHIENAEYANAPIINASNEVAILVYSRQNNTSVIVIVEAGKVDPSYSTATKFS